MRPPQVVYRFVIVFIFEKLLEPFNRPGVQATGPALRLADLGAGLFEGRDLLLGPGLPFELHHAVHQGEQRVVLAETDVLARVEGRTDLTHEDAAGGDGSATEDLDATALRLGIATVAG